METKKDNENKDKKIFLVKGFLSKEITKYLNEEYKKEVDENTGIVLESMIFLNINNIAKQIEENPEAFDIETEKVNTLFSIDSKDVIDKELENMTSLFSKLDNDQLRNSAVLLINEENTEIRSPTIETFCNNINVPIYYSLDSYIKDKKVK